MEEGFGTRETVSRSYTPNQGPLIYNGGNSHSRIQQDLGLHYVWALFQLRFPEVFPGLGWLVFNAVEQTLVEHRAFARLWAGYWDSGINQTRQSRKRGAEHCGPQDRITTFPLRVVKFAKKSNLWFWKFHPSSFGHPLLPFLMPTSTLPSCHTVERVPDSAWCWKGW